MYAEYNTGERGALRPQARPFELHSRHNDPAYASVKAELADRLHELRTAPAPSCRIHEPEPAGP